MTSKNTTTWGQWGDRRGMGEQFGGLIYVFIYRATALPLPLLPPFPQSQKSFYTEDLLHRRPFTQKTFYTEDLLHKKSFYTEDSQESQD